MHHLISNLAPLFPPSFYLFKSTPSYISGSCKDVNAQFQNELKRLINLSQNKLLHHLWFATVCKEHNTAFVISTSLQNCYKHNWCLCLCRQLLSLLVKEERLNSIFYWQVRPWRHRLSPNNSVCLLPVNQRWQQCTRTLSICLYTYPSFKEFEWTSKWKPSQVMVGRWYSRMHCLEWDEPAWTMLYFAKLSVVD